MFKAKAVAPLPAKVSGSAGWPEGGRVAAILRVSLDGHVPHGVALRSRIDGRMFTGEFDAAELARIAADPAVESIALSRRVQPVGKAG